jgi:NADPH2:quinone reductase
MTIVATASSEAGRQFAVKQGAHHATDHDITQRADDVQSLTGGHGFDLILEFLANQNLASDLTALAKRGRVVVIGSRGTIEIDPWQTMMRESEILGLTLNAATPEQRHQIFSALTAALESQTLRPVIGLELPLSQAPEAHRQIMDGHHFGKIVLIP